MAEVELERGYSEQQAVRDGEYERAYLNWLESLTPAEREQLNELEVGKPLVYHARAGATWKRPSSGFRDSTTQHGLRGLKTTDPEPWHPVDILEPETEEPLGYDDEELARLGAYDPELLATLLRILFFPEPRRCSIKAAWMRLVSLAHVLHIEGVGEKSLEQLAKEMNCTRALLSHYCCILRDFGKLDCHGGKTLTARAILSRAHLPDWKKGGRKARARRVKQGTLLGTDDQIVISG